MINIASGANHSLRYVAESTAGTTPTNPSTAILAHKACSLIISRETINSETLRGDRMIPDAITGTSAISGSIDCELGAEEYDDLLEAALAGNWESDVLKAGMTKHSFTFERAFTDIGQYGVFRGCYINNFTLSVNPSALANASFAVVGLSGEYATSQLAVPTASKNPAAFNSFTGSLEVDGTELAIVTGLELSLENGIEAQYALMDRSAKAVSYGRSNLTGTITAFFADATLLGKFLNDTAVSLVLTLERNNASYEFKIPRLFYTGADNAVSGEGVISLSMPFQAAICDTLGTNLQITRIL